MHKQRHFAILEGKKFMKAEPEAITRDDAEAAVGALVEQYGPNSSFPDEPP